MLICAHTILHTGLMLLTTLHWIVACW